MDAGTEGLAFFYTNVLVAASISKHIHHEESRIRLVSLQKDGGAEAYNTLTRFPKGYGVSPMDAARMLHHAGGLYQLAVLTAQETLQTIEAAAALGASGSLIYDALLLACARKIDASRIYTHNVKQFRQIAPDLAARILIP